MILILEDTVGDVCVCVYTEFIIYNERETIVIHSRTKVMVWIPQDTIRNDALENTLHTK